MLFASLQLPWLLMLLTLTLSWGINTVHDVFLYCRYPQLPRNSQLTQILYSCVWSVSVYCQSDTRSCAATVCGAEERRGVGRKNQQGNHFQLCSCAAWLARSQVSPGRVGSPLLLSSLLSLANLRRALSPTLQSNRREKNPTSNFWNSNEELPKMTNLSASQADRLNMRGKWFFPHLRRKRRGLRAFFPPHETSKSASVNTGAFELELNLFACDLMSPGFCGGPWRMPGCPQWSPICLSSGWASTGWCGARSAPPHGSASRWSSRPWSASGSAWRATARIPASKATTPRWSRRTGRAPTRWSDRASGSVSDGGLFIYDRV